VENVIHVEFIRDHIQQQQTHVKLRLVDVQNVIRVETLLVDVRNIIHAKIVIVLVKNVMHVLMMYVVVKNIIHVSLTHVVVRLGVIQNLGQQYLSAKKVQAIQLRLDVEHYIVIHNIKVD
jgi:hypothetical protein